MIRVRACSTETYPWKHAAQPRQPGESSVRARAKRANVAFVVLHLYSHYAFAVSDAVLRYALCPCWVLASVSAFSGVASCFYSALLVPHGEETSYGAACYEQQEEQDDGDDVPFVLLPPLA